MVYIVKSGAPIPAPATRRATKYPWDIMATEEYFDVPLTDADEPRKVCRRVYASGRAWCQKHKPATKPVVRHITDGERQVARCWLVVA